MASTKADIVKRYREATGMNWLSSKLLLAGKSPELLERILQARTQQPGATTLHDPIEDHPDYTETIAAIADEITKELRDEIARENAKRRAAGKATSLSDWPLGTSHQLWRRLKKRLADQGITWHSIAEMNPGCRFD